MRSAKHPPPERGTGSAWGVCGFLLLAVGLIYGQTLGHPLLDYDDPHFVQANPHVTAGLTAEDVRWAFVDGPFGEWFPLALLSHMLDVELFGLEPWGHHFSSLLLHAAASLALFLVLRQMTGELWPSAFVATIFAIHPQHVESVAWIAERRDVLSGLLFMLTLATWLGYLRHGRPYWRYLLTLALFALGLMAKPVLVTLPPLLLLLDFWPLARLGSASDIPPWTTSLPRPSPLRLVVEKLPFVALAAGDCLLTLRTHSKGTAAHPWLERLGNAPVLCVRYIIQFFYPIDLALLYPMPVGGQPLWAVVGAVAILLAISAAVVIRRRKDPYAFVGWFWYLGMLFPVIGLVQMSDYPMADRYTYLSGIGLYIALTWGAARWAGQIPQRRRMLAIAAGLATLLCIGLAIRQTSFWRDDETLWRRALAYAPANAEAEVALADALVLRGKHDEALTYYQRAQSHPTDYSAFNNLGWLFRLQGKLDEAIAQYRLALKAYPDAVKAHVNLGEALVQRQQFAEALAHFQRALELDPQAAGAHHGWGQMLLLQGNYDAARAELERAVAIDPRLATARNDLGFVLLEQQQVDPAIAQLQAALTINPRMVLAHINLARALTRRGQIPQAQDECRRALELDPQNVLARETLSQLRAVQPAAP